MTTPRRVIVDTDCGTDDLLAIAFLAVNPEIDLIAVTTVHGLTRALQGANNVRRVLDRLGKSSVDVLVGSDQPLSGSRTFPEDWKHQTEELRGVCLPQATLSEADETAQKALAAAIIGQPPTTILALGPWTNIAQALRMINAEAMLSGEIFCMGGAFDVPGNVFATSIGTDVDPSAEWNFYLDPTAVAEVLNRSITVTIVPLDATRKAAITEDLLSQLRAHTKTAAIVLALEITNCVKNWITEGQYFAWDVVAAVLLSSPHLGKRHAMNVSIQTEGFDAGRVLQTASGRPVEYFASIDHDEFEKVFSYGLAQCALPIDG